MTDETKQAWREFEVGAGVSIATLKAQLAESQRALAEMTESAKQWREGWEQERAMEIRTRKELAEAQSRAEYEINDARRLRDLALRELEALKSSPLLVLNADGSRVNLTEALAVRQAETEEAIADWIQETADGWPQDVRRLCECASAVRSGTYRAPENEGET